jgi:hypothetical protein
MTSDDEVQPTSGPPGRDDPAVQDLAAFALQWSHDLEELTSRPDRAEQHRRAAATVIQSIRSEASGAWDFARTWLRRLGDDIAADRLPSPLPTALQGDTQEIVRAIIDRHREDIESLAAESVGDPMKFVRQSPRAAGMLRDLGRIVESLRGSGALGSEDPEVIRQLVEFDESLRHSSRRAVGTVPEHLRLSRQDLVQWADSGAGYDLPGLLRRLVIETTDGLELVHFPAGVGATSGDWDGVVRATVGNAFVPEGVSGWEISAEKNSNAKAEDDYAKRLSAPDGSATADVTYVEVILRPWTKARAFATEHTSEGRWNEVRAYNVETLETWLEHAPSTTIWLAEQLGRPVAGVRTAEQWWSGWLQSTRIPLRASVVLAGRESASESLRQRVGSPGTTTVGGDLRLEEMQAFVAATFAPGGEIDRPVLFLSDSEEARKLLARPGELVVVAPHAAFAREVSASGHHVIIPTPGSDRADISIPPVSSRLAAEALEAEGVGHRESREYGTLARRSLLALRRRAALNPSLHEPSWSAPGADIVRRRVLLANTWNQTWPGDREALEELMGQPYATIEDALRTLAAGPDDPMVAVVDERWHVVSPMDAWLLLGAQISTSDLEALRRHALEVLLERDPLAGLSEDDRFRASLEGTRRRFSGELVRGAANALALLGTVDSVVRITGGQTGSGVASSVVWELLDTANNDATADTWITLAPHLPLLAEAAPSVFLDELRKAIEPGSPFAERVFADKERGKFGSPPPSPHTHVLWALETLAWSPEHFDAAVSVLATLTELDPGGEWSNRPAASLASVFCPWHPNTSAAVDQRLTTLERLRQHHPDVSWELSLSMLPNAHGFQMVHQGPTYRDWKTAEPVVLRTDYIRVVEDVARALLEDVGTNGERWRQIVKELNDLPPDFRAQARDQLLGLAGQTAFDDAERETLWSDLRDFIAHHREYSDAHWALPASEVDELEVVAEAFAPASAVHRHAWLFDDGLITLGDVHRRDNYEEYEREVAARRTAAIAEILTEEGFDGVLRFATNCAAPGQVGAALERVSAGDYEDALVDLLGSPESARSNLAFGYFAHRFTSGGWDWLDPFLDQHRSGSPAVLSRLLRAAWDPKEASVRADRFGSDVAREFWTNFSYFGLGQDFDEATRLSRRLIEFGRPSAALDLLALYGRRQAADLAYAEAVMSAFESLMEHPDDQELKQLSQYDVDTLLKIVAANRHELGVERAVKVEWYFLPMLGYDPDAQTLHHTLAEDPRFFVEILSMVYRPRSDDEPEPPTEQERAAAENAFRLLHSWSTCPGVDDKGEVTLDGLRHWVSTARALLAERNRVEIGDEQIGQALASAPADPDGSWPCEAVRYLLEELQNDRIDRGLEIRVFNNRGVTSRSLDEGGQKEWKLGEGYRSRAEQFVTRWPRSATIFRRLAETYEADARREDDEAERRSRGLDA